MKLTREELKLTREELRLQRIELERSARSQEKSEEISRDIAKLNGLSSLLDYSMNNKNYQSSIDEFLGKGGAEEIKNDIKNIVSKLK
ncbi:MAG: hypothetical protein NTX91_00220 [candidate division SR1 bacterium]|nr:hypothetical protein [candidate division SR1 bacterium]